jgi:hypothetical protein
MMNFGSVVVVRRLVPGDSQRMSRQSEDPAAQGTRTAVTTRRSDRFLAGLADFKSVIFVSHVHPDPDGIGSMVGLAHLVESKLGLPTRLTRDGQISRAENRALVECLDINLTPIHKVAWDDEHAVVMVDSQPKTGRHSFNGEARLWGVIDHHQTCGDVDGIPFLDIRRGLGATCSLVTRYLSLLRHRERAVRLPARSQPDRRQRPSVSLSARRQGPGRQNPQRAVARRFLRGAAPGLAKLVHLRQAAHQLDQ